MLLQPVHVSLKTLRTECPSWKWHAARYGFGYHYIGTRGEQVAEVFPESTLVGEDDFKTRWIVNDGAGCHEYASWREVQREHD